MSEQPKPDRTLSEISHLFLSSVRERQTSGAPRPLRRPPGNASAPEPGGDGDVALTAEEFARVAGDPESPAAVDPPVAPVSALLAAHLGPRQLQRSQEYAAHLAGGGQRVALIEIDSSEFRLWCIEPATGDELAHPATPTAETLDARRMIEALHELACDVDQWLVLIPNPRLTEARALLRKIQRWVLPVSCKDDGVVSAYRTLKGLRESHHRNEGTTRLPRLCVAILDAEDGTEATRVSSKLAAVADQFLLWPVDSRQTVRPAPHVSAHLVLACQATHDKAQLAAAPQWQIVCDFIRQLDIAAREPAPTDSTGTGPDSVAGLTTVAGSDVTRSSADGFSETRTAPEPRTSGSASGADSRPRTGSEGDAEEVLELPAGETTPEAIAGAVLRGGADLVTCPLHPPMCPQASLAVGRDRRILLIAVARQGLSELRSIGQAYRWLIENRALIAMAVPQLAIDAHQMPRLRLLVDHADMSAGVLQPMLQSGNVSVHAYRKVRWGDKTGLLLEAA